MARLNIFVNAGISALRLHARMILTTISSIRASLVRDARQYITAQISARTIVIAEANRKSTVK